MYLILIVIRCHVPSCPINYTVNKSYHHVVTTRGAMGTFAISSLRFYFVRNGFGFRTEISDANRLLLLCRTLLLLLRWECTWCCWRGLWLTRHVFGIESYDLRATVYVSYTTCVLKGRSAMWNESEVQSSEPTSVRPGLMSASWFQVVSWLATKFRGGKSRKDDMETWYLHLTGWWRPALPFIFRSNARWTSIWRVNCAGQFLSYSKWSSRPNPIEQHPTTSILEHKSCDHPAKLSFGAI